MASQNTASDADPIAQLLSLLSNVPAYGSYITKQIPILSSLPSLGSTPPSLTNILIVLVILYISMLVVGMAVRTVLTMARMLFWVFVVAGAVWVYVEGLDSVAGTLGGLAGEAIGGFEKLQNMQQQPVGQKAGWTRGRTY